MASAATTAARGFERADLSEDQVRVYDEVLAWVRRGGGLLTFGGLAGTGKTTVVAALAGAFARSGLRVAYAAFTGKAASVLRRKLALSGVPDAQCGTLHSLLYIPVEDVKTGRVLGWKLKPSLALDRDRDDRDAPPIDLVVVDEASMVGSTLWTDLRSFSVPVLAVGDHGQLPPVGDGAVDLVVNPDLRLERIHRQAAGNPILALAHAVREGRIPAAGSWGSGDARVQDADQRDAVDVVVERCLGNALDVAMLCHTNRQRVQLNALVRRSRGAAGGFHFDPIGPMPDDAIVCLRNSQEAGLYNGMRGLFRSYVGDGFVDDFGRVRAEVSFPDDGFDAVEVYANLHQFGRLPRAALTAEERERERRPGPTISSFDDLDPDLEPGLQPALAAWRGEKVEAGLLAFGAPLVARPRRPQFWHEVGQLFDFGYAMTVHKAQGSQFSDVVLFPNTWNMEEMQRRKFLYTAITRASERLWVVR